MILIIITTDRSVIYYGSMSIALLSCDYLRIDTFKDLKIVIWLL